MKTLDEMLQDLDEQAAKYQQAFHGAKLGIIRLEPLAKRMEEVGAGKAEVSLEGIPYSWMGKGDGIVRIFLKDQDSWNAALPFIEAANEFGFAEEAWINVEDAKQFARTYSCSQRLAADEMSGAVDEIKIMITVALREGNTGGCRRVFLGKRTTERVTEVEEYKLICDEEKPVDEPVLSVE